MYRINVDTIKKYLHICMFSVPFKGNVACVEVRGHNGGRQSLCCVLLRRLHGCQEGGRVTRGQHERLRVHHLLLVVHLHHHCPIIWEAQEMWVLENNSKQNHQCINLSCSLSCMNGMLFFGNIVHTSALEDVAASSFQPGHVFEAQEGGVHTEAGATLPHPVDVTGTHLRHQRHWEGS